jgi:hypothetical protein
MYLCVRGIDLYLSLHNFDWMSEMFGLCSICLFSTLIFTCQNPKITIYYNATVNKICYLLFLLLMLRHLNDTLGLRVGF